jgi:hypothetical protein
MAVRLSTASFQRIKYPVTCALNMHDHSSGKRSQWLALYPKQAKSPGTCRNKYRPNWDLLQLSYALRRNTSAVSNFDSFSDPSIGLARQYAVLAFKPQLCGHNKVVEEKVAEETSGPMEARQNTR